jgi:RNA polymerase sigma factor (sigma-70 family)
LNGFQSNIFIGFSGVFWSAIMNDSRKDVRRPVGVSVDRLGWTPTDVSEMITLAHSCAWNFIRRFHPFIDPEEIHNEAMLALVFAINGFDVNRQTSFSSYASVCIRNHLMLISNASFRRVKLWSRSIDNFESTIGPSRDPYDIALERNLYDCLRRAMPTRWFEAMEMYHVRGLNFTEIGERLGITRQRAYQLVGKAIALARKTFPEIDSSQK